ATADRAPPRPCSSAEPQSGSGVHPGPASEPPGGSGATTGTRRQRSRHLAPRAERPSTPGRSAQRAAPVLVRRSSGRAGQPTHRGGLRQPDLEGVRPSARWRVVGRVAAVPPRDLTDEVQAEAVRAAGTGDGEPLEQVRHELGRDTATGIGDPDAHMVVVDDSGEADRWEPVTDRVVHEVVEGLPEPHDVDPQDRLLGYVEKDLDVE